MNKLKTALVAVTILALAGCGSSGGGSSSQTTSKPPMVDYASAESIASALDRGGFSCTSWTPNPKALGPRDSGTCTHGTTSVNVSTFTSKDEMAALLASAKRAFGAKASGPSVQGDAWLVTLDDKAQAPEVQKILGGNIK
jgi:hypothetical protein